MTKSADDLGVVEAGSGPLRVFLSYRRKDVPGHAGRLYDRLAGRFGGENVFMDVDAIDLGEDFREVINEAVGSCDVLVTVIGPEWLNISDSSGVRRLENEDDFVRLEIEAALSRDVRVIPILVEGAEMPGARTLPSSIETLAYRNALGIRDANFHGDATKLVQLLERLEQEKPAREKRRREQAEQQAQALRAQQLEERRREDAQREAVEEQRRREQAEQQAQALRAQQLEERRREDAQDARRPTPVTSLQHQPSVPQVVKDALSRPRVRIAASGLAVVSVGLIAVILAMGGSGGSSGGSSGGFSDAFLGGTARMLDTAGGVDSLDPGYWYYQTDYQELGQTTQRWLYGWKPDQPNMTPDIAAGPPELSNAGKTIRIKIKSGIKYSAPLQNRTVHAADVKYAIERCFLPQVANGYVNVYYGDIVGADAFKSGRTKEISGIQTPDDQTLVINTTKPSGVLTEGGALGMPCTAPVPKEYAQKYDKGTVSKYGEHQVFTGPYMVENDGKGKITGYKPGQRLTLVRNPSWDRASDFRPAYFDRIEIKCCSDATVAARQTLRGRNLLSGDYAAPPPSVLKEAVSSYKSQVSAKSSGGNRYISLNTKVKPLDNVNVRRAIAAVMDRAALRQTRGGPTIGTIGTHLLPPGYSGFNTAGGAKGPGFDFMSSPRAKVGVAKSYMKKAGYARGVYNGPPLLTVAANVSPAKDTAEAFRRQLKAIGLKLRLREVSNATMLSKFCLVPKAEVAICPNLGWAPDFFSPQSFIDPLFNGKNITASGNVNTAQVNDPALNAKIETVKQITDAVNAKEVWGELDKEVTSQAYLIPWLWDNQIGLESKNVRGVTSLFNGGAWDLTFSSLK